MTRTARPSPASDAVTAGEAARFAEALGRLLPDGGRVGLAVSGGPDSLAMLLLAQAAIPGGFEVATVDHGLRPEAADEAAFVAATCDKLGVLCEVLAVEVEAGNRQQAARIARYAALSAWAGRRGLAAIATAHHVDDQAETLLMRLNRGSGVAGLAGVRERGVLMDGRTGVVRPVLGWRRAELAAIVGRARIAPVHDPSNEDDGYDRVRIRKALAEAPWIDVAALARSAAHLADAEEGLAHYARMLGDAHASAGSPDLVITKPMKLPREARIRLVRRQLAQLGGSPRGSEIARLVDALATGRGGNLGGVLVTVENGDWVFRPEPARSA